MAGWTPCQQHNAGPLSSNEPNRTDAVGYSTGRSNLSSSSLSFSLHNNQLTPLSPTKESLTCCGRTDAETELSSNQSQASGIRDPRDGRSISGSPSTCMGCIFPMVHSSEERHHKDCFVVIDCSPRLDEPGYRGPLPRAAAIDEDVSLVDRQTITAFIPVISTTTLTPRTVRSKEVSEANYGATMASTSNTLHRRSDISHMGLFTAQTLDAIYSGPSEVIEEEASTPCDRDTQRDVGTASKAIRPKYHTPAQRERIDSDSFRRTMEIVTCEKRSDDSGDSDVSSIALDAFFSPTVEDSNGEENGIVGGTPPTQLLPSSSRKRLIFDSGSLRQYDTPNLPKGTPREGTPTEKNIFQCSSPMTISKQRASPLSALGMSAMSTFQCFIRLLQSIARGSRRCRPTCQRCPRKPHPQHSNTSTLLDGTKERCWILDNEKNIPTSHPTMSTSQLTSTIKREHESSLRRVGGRYDDRFLQKSSTFLKELRRSGQKGEVIIQGWVAFRAGNVASWDSIINNPKRSDFRYIILLEDTLHLFKSRNKKKQKKKDKMSSTPLELPHPSSQKSNVFLQDYISLNLAAGDIAVRIHHVSKEHGNEVCIFHPETEGEVHCSLLPTPMPQSIFLDRHRSRLGKGEVLKCVFHEAFKEKSNTPGGSSSAPSSILSASISTDDERIDGALKASTSSTPQSATTITHDDTDVSPAPTEQYDVSRHVLFAIDAAIRIPTPTKIPRTKNSETNEKGGFPNRERER